jgi:NAD(P)-dependent dehydrogenase (short-subunit alcohol dehydrogenase family)
VNRLPGAIERTARELGGVDVLVNAAATDVPGPVETLEEPDPVSGPRTGTVCWR